MRARTIAVVAFDGISPFHLTVPCVVFGEDRRSIGVPRFEVLVCGLERRRLTTSAGFRIEATHGLDAVTEAKTIIVPSWRDTAETPPAALTGALRAAHRKGARVVGLCLGAFVLAAAGLLDGRRATTHWAWAREFAERFPGVLLNPEALYVDEGDVVTSAGTAAGIDCCLHLVREQLGAEIANRLARRLVVAPHRSGGQAQFIEAPVPKDAGGDRLAQSLEWAVRNLGKPLRLEDLAAKAAMSPRTYTRRFKAATGTSFKRWLIEQRVSAARRLLERGDASMERVAAAAGFGTPLSMRLHFAERLGMSPVAYRRAFRGRDADGAPAS
jgi:transcriptional regulator GlxA family with amidase domain